MSDLLSFYLNVSGRVCEVDCIEISHPSWPKPFRYTTYDEDGISLQHEDSTTHFYEFQDMSIESGGVKSDLDQELKLTINDYDDTLIEAYENITDRVPVSVKRRIYRDDILTEPMQIIETLNAVSMTKNSTGQVTFEAIAQELNSVKTGDTYSIERFPMLRGTL
ncbi:hypothetical protein EC844_12524 [Acinetobacter calcoaceticus]|uniref:DUF1833 domain-containing protein n=1 Tax=Acinetobacter calcoaceticus TaxID=471 RepID=A0A4R1XGJ5_ACICA|nr:hypothetical protein EC844_12524 [Acinetobacter calcoaceticus]